LIFPISKSRLSGFDIVSFWRLVMVDGWRDDLSDWLGPFVAMLGD
jgi:drug/metabolite transporter superfamily protein YnfA